MDLPPSREPSPSYEPVKIASISLYSNRTHFRATDKSFFDSSQLKLYHAFVTGVSLGEICKKVTQYLLTRTHTHTPHTCTHTPTNTHTLLYTHTHTNTHTNTYGSTLKIIDTWHKSGRDIKSEASHNVHEYEMKALSQVITF